MNLLSLGTAQRRIFAIHDPPSGANERPRAAVLCNPGGAEAVYAHRSLRHLALRLARLGFHVVRFDYFGTGDSGGADEEAGEQGMQSDLEYAIEAARDVAGSSRVTLVGLRLGAVIAARFAARQPQGIESLVMWDPLEPPPPVAQAVPRRLLLVTDPGETIDDAIVIAAPCCWVESITTSGALPVAAFQYIEKWLR